GGGGGGGKGGGARDHPRPQPSPTRGEGAYRVRGGSRPSVGKGADRASGEGLSARVVVDCAQNVLEHAIDIRQDVVVPIAQHAIAVGFENPRAVVIGSRSLAVLATIDLDNNAPRVTRKIDDVAANSNLATETCASAGKPVAQVPPEFPLCFRRRGAHLAGELTLSWHDVAIALGPDSRFVPCGHIVVPRLRPPPQPHPTRGRGADRMRGTVMQRPQSTKRPPLPRAVFAAQITC